MDLSYLSTSRCHKYSPSLPPTTSSLHTCTPSLDHLLVSQSNQPCYQRCISRAIGWRDECVSQPNIYRYQAPPPSSHPATPLKAYYRYCLNITTSRFALPPKKLVGPPTTVVIPPAGGWASSYSPAFGPRRVPSSFGNEGENFTVVTTLVWARTIPFLARLTGL